MADQPPTDLGTTKEFLITVIGSFAAALAAIHRITAMLRKSRIAREEAAAQAKKDIYQISAEMVSGQIARDVGRITQLEAMVESKNVLIDAKINEIIKLRVDLTMCEQQAAARIARLEDQIKWKEQELADLKAEIRERDGE